jgi:hypothetical protein
MKECFGNDGYILPAGPPESFISNDANNGEWWSGDKSAYILLYEKKEAQ